MDIEKMTDATVNASIEDFERISKIEDKEEQKEEIQKLKDKINFHITTCILLSEISSKMDRMITMLEKMTNDNSNKTEENEKS